MNAKQVLILGLASALTVGLSVDAVARGHGGGGYRGSSGGGHHSSGTRAYHPRATYAPAYHPPRAPSLHPRRPHIGNWPRSKPVRSVPQAHAPSAYREYRREVDRMSNANYRQHRSSLDPGHMRGRRGHMDLDHVTPVKQCFDRGMSAAQCANPGNLRMLDAHRNRSEGCRGCRKGR